MSPPDDHDDDDDDVEGNNNNIKAKEKGIIRNFVDLEMRLKFFFKSYFGQQIQQIDQYKVPVLYYTCV